MKMGASEAFFSDEFWPLLPSVPGEGETTIMTSESLVLLTIRGTLVPKTLESACGLHNETAGSAQGIAAARGLPPEAS